MAAAPSSLDPLPVVFTDLDGTLLDARTYSAEPAREALQRLGAAGVPVVFCSSKTAAEQRALREELGIRDAPFIVENGAAVLVPEASGLPVVDWPRAASDGGERVRVLGVSRSEVRAGIARAAAVTGLRVTGYADLSTDEVARLTGLSHEAAARAQQRDYSETLVDAFTAEAWARFASALTAEGLAGRHGGRFHTVTAADVNKGRAVREATALFARASRQPVRTAGIGDSANDEDLLRAVDRAFLVARPDGSCAPLDVPGLRRIAHAGPAGWVEAVAAFLAQP